MKNLLRILPCLMITGLTVNAQQNEFKFGLQVFPSIVYSRVSPQAFEIATNQKNSYEGNGVRLRGGFGGFTDYHFTDNFVIHGGINFIVVGSGYKVNSYTGANFSEKHSLQYVQLPLALKIISNEIHNHLYFSFMAGITAEVAVAARINGEKEFQPAPGAPVEKYYSYFRPINSSLLINPGIEYRLNGNFRLIAGVTYARGLLDYARKRMIKHLPNDIDIFNDYFALNLGVKF